MSDHRPCEGQPFLAADRLVADLVHQSDGKRLYGARGVQNLGTMVKVQEQECTQWILSALKISDESEMSVLIDVTIKSARNWWLTPKQRLVWGFRSTAIQDTVMSMSKALSKRVVLTSKYSTDYGYFHELG